MLNIDFKKPRKQIKHGVLANKQKSKDELFQENDKKMTYADRQKKKNFGNQEKPNPFVLHAKSRNPSLYPTFQAPSVRVIDLRNKHMRERRSLITMPGLSREIQLIDETDVIKSRLKEQTAGGKGKPWFERKETPKYGNGGTRMIPPHVTRIKIPKGAVDKKLIGRHYQGSQYAFSPSTTVYVKRFVDTPIGTPAVREFKKPLKGKEMYYGDMQRCFSHYYRGGSLYVRKTDKKLDGNRMLKLRVLARKNMKKELAKEEILLQKEKEKSRRLKRKVGLKKRPSSSNSKKRSRRKKVSNNMSIRPMTR